MIYNADIEAGERIFSDISKKDPENPAPPIYRAMALMSYPPREDGAKIDRAQIESLLIEGIGKASAGIDENLKSVGDSGRIRLLVATAHSLLAQLYLEDGRYIKAADAALSAKKYLDEAYEYSPEDPDVLYAVGLLIYGIDTLPGFLKPVLSVMDLKGDRVEGLRLLKEAAKGGVYTSAAARFSLLVILVNIEGDFEEAVKYGRELFIKYPGNPELYFPYAYALSETGDFDAALSVAAGFKKRLDEKKPFFDEAVIGRYHHLLGKIYMDMGDFDTALMEFEEAKKVSDENYQWVKALAIARMGMIEDIRGNRSIAIERYEEVLEMGVSGVGMDLAKKYIEEPYSDLGDDSDG